MKKMLMAISGSLCLLLLTCIVGRASDALPPPGGKPWEWGMNIVNREAGLANPNVIQLSANSTWSLALLSDGSLFPWGAAKGSGGASTNAPSGIFIHSRAGWQHAIACRPDGTVAEWGKNSLLWAAYRPVITNCIKVDAGDLHSAALLADGTVLTWGTRPSVTNWSGLIKNAIDIASTWYGLTILLDDGTVMVIGDARAGQDNTVPPGLNNVVRVAAGFFHNLAIKADGTIVTWGLNEFGQCNPPPDATNIVAAAGGRNHTIALRSDGKVIAWGDNTHGQLNIPTDRTFAFVSAGFYHSQAIEGMPGGLPPPPPPPPVGNMRHVSLSGNDSNPGTEAEPWLTVQHAVDNVSAGDTIKLGPGTYDEVVQVSLSGAQDNRITIDGQDVATVKAFVWDGQYWVQVGITVLRP